MRVGIPQANSTTSMPRLTSPAASAASLPFSSVTRSLSSSKCSSSSALNPKSNLTRSTTGVAAQDSNATWALFTARSTSSFVERGVRARLSPVAGSYTGSVSRPSRSSHSPPIKFLTSRRFSLGCIPSSSLAAECFEVFAVEVEGGVQQVGVGVHRLTKHRLERLHLPLRALHQAAGHLLAALHTFPELGGHITEEILDQMRALLLQRRVPVDNLPVGLEALGEGAAGTLLAPDGLLDGVGVALHSPGKRPVGLGLALQHTGHALDPALGELDVPLLCFDGASNHLPVGLAERLRQPPRRLGTAFWHSFLLRPLFASILPVRHYRPRPARQARPWRREEPRSPPKSSGGGSSYHPPSSPCSSGPRGCALRPAALLRRRDGSGHLFSPPVRCLPARRERSGPCLREGKALWVAEEVRVRSKSLPCPRVRAIRSLRGRSAGRV